MKSNENKALKKMREDLFDLSIEIKTEKTKNPNLIKRLKKNIARHLTNNK